MCIAMFHQRVALLQSKEIACLRPEDGEGISTNSHVVFDEMTGAAEPFHKAMPSLREDLIRDALKVCV